MFRGCEEAVNYENAKDLLPEELFKELQKYAEGKLLYVPASEEKKTWGQASGYRDKLKKRNRMICNKYAGGRTISELADEYFLSLDSIKKIVYSKNKNTNLQYYPTLTSAIEYTNEGMMEEWIQSFLLFTCKDDKLSEELIKGEYIYFGVVKLPLRFVQTEEIIAKEDNVSEEVDVIEEAERPPLIIKYVQKKFYTAVHQKKFMELKNLKINAYPSFVIVNGNEDYNSFMKHYSKQLMVVELK
jgi:Mor family transcriptional regulator